jgi:hypothetical protein
MLKALAAELIGMFVADKQLATAALVIVAVAGSLIVQPVSTRSSGGAVPLFGCLILLIGTVCRRQSGRLLGRRAGAHLTCLDCTRCGRSVRGNTAQVSL